MPLIDSFTRLKAYLLERCTDELRLATDCNFTFGYTGEGNEKFSITSEVQLAEALSLVKKGMITLLVDPHLPKAKNPLVSTSGKKRKGIVILPEYHPRLLRLYTLGSVLLKKAAGIQASLIPLVMIRDWFKAIFCFFCS